MLEGSVEMVKRSANDMVVATFTHTSTRPWFGELALLHGGKRRSCAAVCREPTKVLCVRSESFAHFLEICPSFQAMFMQQSVAYAALDRMRRGYEKDDDILNEGASLMAAHATLGEGDDESEASSQMASETVVHRWERMTAGLTAKGRLNQGLAEEQREREADERERRGGRAVRRVSYVAANHPNLHEPNASGRASREDSRASSPTRASTRES